MRFILAFKKNIMLVVMLESSRYSIKVQSGKMKVSKGSLIPFKAIY